MFIDGTPRSYFGRFGNIADMDYWTPTNPTNKNPGADARARVDRLYAATRLYTDGSHWRIRNITAGYTLDVARVAQRLGPHSLRLYATAQDPYIHTTTSASIPRSAAPFRRVRTLLLGTNIVW